MMSPQTQSRLSLIAILICSGVPSWFFIEERIEKSRAKARARQEQTASPTPASGSAVLPGTQPALLPGQTPAPSDPARPVMTSIPRPARIVRNTPDAASASFSPQSLQVAIQNEVAPAIQKCLEEWQELEPSFSGSIQLQFVLKPEGLDSVSLLDHTGIPSGPLTCFAGSLWEAELPLPSEETTITYPFKVEVGED
jgi:hypothetical protein